LTLAVVLQHSEITRKGTRQATPFTVAVKQQIAKYIDLRWLMLYV